MEFTFYFTRYNEALFISQINKILEKRTELVSRKKYPKMWKAIDKMNLKKKAPDQVLEKRYKRYKVYGVFLMFLGLGLLIPSLMEPKEMIFPLFLALFTFFLGLFYFRHAKNGKKKKSKTFDKGARKLYKVYEKAYENEFAISFNDDEIRLGEDIIKYDDLEKIFQTEDFFTIIWNGNLIVFQKKDLSNFSIDQFANFISQKTEVCNISH